MERENAQPPWRVLVVDLDATVATSLAGLTGWRVVTIGSADVLLVEVYRSIDPHVVVGSSAGYGVIIDKLLPIRRRPVVIVGDDDWPTVSGLIEHGVSGYARTPVDPIAFASCLDATCRANERIESLSHEKHLLAQTLETRKLVDRAKAIFMRRLNLDEPTAHKRLQQESQNRRIAIGDLARRIIESEELLGERVQTAEN